MRLQEEDSNIAEKRLKRNVHQLVSGVVAVLKLVRTPNTQRKPTHSLVQAWYAEKHVIQRPIERFQHRLSYFFINRDARAKHRQAITLCSYVFAFKQIGSDYISIVNKHDAFNMAYALRQLDSSTIFMYRSVYVTYMNDLKHRPRHRNMGPWVPIGTLPFFWVPVGTNCALLLYWKKRKFKSLIRVL